MGLTLYGLTQFISQAKPNPFCWQLDFDPKVSAQDMQTKTNII